MLNKPRGYNSGARSLTACSILSLQMELKAFLCCNVKSVLRYYVSKAPIPGITLCKIGIYIFLHRSPSEQACTQASPRMTERMTE